MNMKTLAIAVILLCSFVLASSSVRADQDDYWYQGRRGRWIQQENAWLFRDVDGNVYRREGGVWRWYNPGLATADADDWYQGRRGHWVLVHDAWRFRDIDGNVYRQHGNSWRWYNGRAHGEEGVEYHNRAPGDNRTYQQFQEQEGR